MYERGFGVYVTDVEIHSLGPSPVTCRKDNTPITVRRRTLFLRWLYVSLCLRPRCLLQDYRQSPYTERRKVSS